MGTKVELCLQRALKERYETFVLVINVGYPRCYIYSLRLTSWNKIEEGSNLQSVSGLKTKRTSRRNAVN